MLENEMFPSGNDYNQHQARILARQSEITNYAEYLHEKMLSHKSADMSNWVRFLTKTDGPILAFDS